MKTDREIAEEFYRLEHPRRASWIPFGHRPELSDLWPQDQEEYVRKVAMARKLWSSFDDITPSTK